MTLCTKGADKVPVSVPGKDKLGQLGPLAYGRFEQLICMEIIWECAESAWYGPMLVSFHFSFLRSGRAAVSGAKEGSSAHCRPLGRGGLQPATAVPMTSILCQPHTVPRKLGTLQANT